jgi:hypothetical protein
VNVWARWADAKFVIKQALLNALASTFPRLQYQVGDSPNPIVVIKAIHPSIGDLVIWDEGDEALLSIEGVTHGHLASYDDGTPEERTIATVKIVVEFLKDLFDDRVVLWRSFGGAVGGWKVYESRAAIPKRGLAAERFVWSGPLR